MDAIHNDVNYYEIIRSYLVFRAGGVRVDADGTLMNLAVLSEDFYADFLNIFNGAFAQKRQCFGTKQKGNRPDRLGEPHGDSGFRDLFAQVHPGEDSQLDLQIRKAGRRMEVFLRSHYQSGAGDEKHLQVAGGAALQRENGRARHLPDHGACEGNRQA